MKRGSRILAVMMAAILAIQTAAPVYAQSPYNATLLDVVEQAQVEQPGVEDSEQSLRDTENQVTQEQDASIDSVEENSSLPEDTTEPVYQDGVILLYTYEQLCAVGTGQPVTDADVQQMGSGEPVTESDGTSVVYALDADYRLIQDIELPEGQLWQLPDGFTGRIAPAEMPQDASLYDAERRMICIYHPYQLMTIAQDDAADQPVLDQDWDASSFGMGNLIYPDGEDSEFLTYDPANRYVLSASFCSDMPELMTAVSEQTEEVSTQNTTSSYDGRDFAGQVIKEINGETYILIGNAYQLDAIGTDTTVYTAVYQTKWDIGEGSWVVDTDDNGKPIMLYGGDADLLESQNGNENYTFGEDGIKSEASGKGCSGVDEQGNVNPGLTMYNSKTSGATYSSTANYIIFRDIDVNDLGNEESQANWTPLTFSGTMIGAKAQNGETLWNDDSTSITATGCPVISNVRVIQDTALDVGETVGIGFFATLSSETGEMTGDTGEVSFGSTGATEVSNLILDHPIVHTLTDETTYEQTLINGLLSVLGWIVGGVLDIALGLLGINVGLQDVLTDLLNARQSSPTALATGAFAGRVVGEVRITNCKVVSPDIINNDASTGGFVGYSEGVTSYATEKIGGIIDLLSDILNSIPGLGLGDLITILLDNGLDVGHLVPTGYTAPQITDCHVNSLNGTIGNDKNSYAGGFIGLQIGTKITGCTVKGEQYTVLSSGYGGGFAGLARDADIQGLLSEVGVELVRVIQPQSLLLDCSIDATGVTVEGGDNLGGFAGALANSYAINDTLLIDELHVNGSGSCVGGVCGIATVGWISSLGDAKESSLLTTVKDLLLELLSTDPSQGQMLLSLVGIQPSAIMGCQINPSSDQESADNTVKVNGGSYVGGFVGKGDGVYLTESSQTYLEELPLWKWRSASGSGVPDVENITEKLNELNGLSEITGSGDYVGGVAGLVGTASVTALLNDTLGVGDFLGFEVSNLSVTGVSEGYTVQATGDYAGGAFGLATGGNAKNITLKNLGSVTAKNRAGGFVGCAGPGDLAGSGGLKLGLLGVDLLELKNLLSVADGIRVCIENCNVEGVGTGFTVEAKGANAAGEVKDFVAGGFIGKSNSTQIQNSHVKQIKSVTADGADGFAGGYVGTSETGGLAEVAEENDISSLLEANGILQAVGYLIPTCTACTVTYVDGGYVQADVAGGFAGQMQSGKVDNQSYRIGEQSSPYAVYNIDAVKGGTYGGGFGGIVCSGALADAGGGISILGKIGNLSINLGDLLSVIEAYVPYIEYAGVKSENGFTVTANTLRDTEATSGSAGGFIGYASGAQISTCDVTDLKRTDVTSPDNLEAVDAPSYFDESSAYAVTGGRYAGGFIGCMDIGSAASVGGGLEILGSSIQLTDVLSALSVVVTTIEHSDVTGAAGGYSVLSSATDGSGAVGMAGGFAGAIYGGHIQNSHANNFEYIIGQIAAGGYVGEMEPGDVAKLLDNASILSSVVDIKETLASVLKTFVPTIRNSTTDCVPCGGAVRAQATSDQTTQRGMAGGYVGHNMGGSIWGLNTDSWKTASDPYAGPTSLCTAERIRSVYGAEYAGGYTGFMEAADTAKVGGLSVLSGLIEVGNILSLLKVVYPTQENTAVYGPLANLDWETWNRWVEAVGKKGAYGYELAQEGTVANQDELDAKLADYICGFNIVAGRSARKTLLANPGGDAGGYVGLMRSGTLTNCMTYDVKLVRGWHAAGGFAGQMETGGAADFGTVSILGLDLDVGQLVNVAEIFVPAVKNSTVQGYTSGMTVESTGLPSDNAGYAGGYVGCSYGAQIQLNSDGLPDSQTWSGTEKYPAPVASCDATNLRRVTGRNSIGGYVGLASAASLASVNTNASGGLLQGILDAVITSASELIDLLPATVTTIYKARISSADEEWGFVVDGAYTTDNSTVQYAPYAGGFAGELQAAILGEKDATEDVLTVTGLRRVDGGLYAGGFFGLADVAAVAELSGTNSEGETTDILGELVNLGSLDALDVLRCYVYRASVNGVAEGYRIQAHSTTSEGILDEERQTGCAGGFGGGIMNGTVKNSTVNQLSTVQALNYTGGFIGHMGKSGAVDIDSLEALNKLLGATVGALDLFGSQVYDSNVQGYSMGAVIKATGGEQPIAGGFVGYSDLGRIEGSNVTKLKKVTSDQVAGGFIGKTDMNYIISAQIQSQLLEAVLKVVNTLLKALYVNATGLESIDLVDLHLGILKVEVLNDGNALKVELLGLPITVALSKKSEDNGQQTDVAIITIGDSVIRLPCSEDGVQREDLENAEINLIKGNRTELDRCTTTGVNNGYDVFGGGATQEADGTGEMGISGGFVGYNHEGKLSNCTMTLCDVVRGTEEKVGAFSGYNDLKSVYAFNTVQSIEGENNVYSIYRPYDAALTQVVLSNDTKFGTDATEDTSTDTKYNRYSVTHLQEFDEFSDLLDAKETGTDAPRDLLVYASAAKAVLMMDANAPDNPYSDVSEPGEIADACLGKVNLTIQKIWKDWSDLEGLRPDAITVIIYRQEFGLDGSSLGEKEVYRQISLTETVDLESAWSNTWRKVIEEVPVARYETDAEGNPTDEIAAYYVYSFEEQSIPKYTTDEIVYNEDTYQVTITNRHDPTLPDTGGIGSWIFVVVGVGIVLSALLMYKRRSSRKGGS